jgi:2-polyprenyl-6-methoxyphenol hydroxylase-like FAD-dependent oxidoreductase
VHVRFDHGHVVSAQYVSGADGSRSTVRSNLRILAKVGWRSNSKTPTPASPMTMPRLPRLVILSYSPCRCLPRATSLRYSRG